MSFARRAMFTRVCRDAPWARIWQDPQEREGPLILVAGKAAMGRCETLDGESVVTRFFLLGPFLVPLDTIYTIGFGRDRTTFPVKRHYESIALAYLRWIILPLVLLFTFIGASGDQTGAPQLTIRAKLALIVIAAIWLASIFLVGRTMGSGARQRRLLSRLVGQGARPEILMSGTIELVLEDLEKGWTEWLEGHGSYRSLGAAGGWRNLFPKDVPDEALPLYYALCRYEAGRSGEPVMTNRAALAWQRIEAAQK